MNMSERNPKPKVVVVGGAYVDLAIKCTEVPAAGQTTAGTALSLTATGPGVNQAIEAALCGCEVYLISKISNCPLGATIKSVLEQYDVKIKYVFIAQAKTKNALVMFRGSASPRGRTSQVLPQTSQLLRWRALHEESPTEI